MDKKFYYPEEVDVVKTQYESKYAGQGHNYSVQSDTDIQIEEIVQEKHNLVEKQENRKALDNDEESLSNDLERLWAWKQQKTQETGAETHSPHATSGILSDISYGFRNFVKSLDEDAVKLDNEQRTNGNDLNTDLVDISRNGQTNEEVGPPMTSMKAMSLKRYDPWLRNLQDEGEKPVSGLQRSFPQEEETLDSPLPRTSFERVITEGLSFIADQSLNDLSEDQSGSFLSRLPDNVHSFLGGDYAEFESKLPQSIYVRLEAPHNCDSSHSEDILDSQDGNECFKLRQRFGFQHSQCRSSSESSERIFPQSYQRLHGPKSKIEEHTISDQNQFDPGTTTQPEPEFRSMLPYKFQPKLKAEPPHPYLGNASSEKEQQHGLWSHGHLHNAAESPKLVLYPSSQISTNYLNSQTDIATPLSKYPTESLNEAAARNFSEPLFEVWSRAKAYSICSSEASMIGAQSSDSGGSSAINSIISHSQSFSSSLNHSEDQDVPQRRSNGRLDVGRPRAPDVSCSPQHERKSNSVSQTFRRTSRSRWTDSCSSTSYSSHSSDRTSEMTDDVILHHQVDRTSGAPLVPRDSCTSMVQFRYSTMAESPQETAKKSAIVLVEPVRRRSQPKVNSQEQQKIQENIVSQPSRPSPRMAYLDVSINHQKNCPQHRSPFMVEALFMSYQSKLPPKSPKEHRLTYRASGDSRTASSEERPVDFLALPQHSPRYQSHLSPVETSYEHQLPSRCSRQTEHHTAVESQGINALDAVNTECHTAIEDPSNFPLSCLESQPPVLVKLKFGDRTVIHQVMQASHRESEMQNKYNLRENQQSEEIYDSAEDFGMRCRRSIASLPSAGQEVLHLAQKIINESSEVERVEYSDDEKITDGSRKTLQLQNNQAESPNKLTLPKPDYFLPMKLSSQTDIIKQWRSIELIRKRQPPLGGGLYSQTNRLQFLPIDMLDADTSGGPIFEGDYVQYAMERSKYFAEKFAKLSVEEIAEDLQLRLRQIRTLQNTAESLFEPLLARPISPTKVKHARHSCPLGLVKCPTLLDAELLAHFCSAHLKKLRSLQLREVFESDSLLIVFNPTSIRLAVNTCMSILVYGGTEDDDSTLPLKRLMPVRNANLTEPYACFEGHLPILVMICRNKVSAVNSKLASFKENESDNDTNKENEKRISSEDEDVFALWAVTMELPRPLHVLMTVFNSRLDISRSNIMSVRGLHKSHNSAEFMSCSKKYMRISEADMEVLSNGFTEPVYLELTVREYATSSPPA
ncbi:uncharacterized protein LOC117588615 [Drosophila guanche]|uniref:DUF4729 domain-containing protein n=1 Tax=Drosophila guanche TaxID=7266 RepID=A0A3B0KJN5_DROGU|nr:uncharacterized protein LOC117588615 [Drosophila guanche]SPP86699.1 Hypothetical predicted protein [Drosophila guanche]